MESRVTAILGPTNTGKTHLAVETMLGYESGIVGFPLRLLAREIYDKCVSKVGSNKVALVTGEEKIIPADAKYYVCTVESMPKDLVVEFVAVDEIQMCADQERGHIFTDRLLNLRGTKLTMFLGSHTMNKIIQQLVENVEFVKRERYSKLSYAGYKKISRLEPRTAIIAFSVEEVYAIAELVRRQKGGAAVIMGSLSPKTRNSQVKLYQSGDVDFLVATDAIGMGINMNINNVYFSGLKKFDGKKTRKLNLSEISQIAGRAGRHINDGNFGVTGQSETFTSDEIEKIESHTLQEIEWIYWRNSELNYENYESLLKSLEKKSSSELLKRASDTEDEKIFKLMIKDINIIKIINEKEYLKTLWECCQIPDFAKKDYGKHLDVVKKVFSFLSSKNKKVSNLYMNEQLKNFDKDNGNMDVLSNRISNVRIWSYVANKRGWVENQDYWVERTKNIEDKLSDQLHEELTRSFIDKRISVLSRSLKQDIVLGTQIKENENVEIDGQFIGKLIGLKLNLSMQSNTLDTDIKSLKKAARQAIAPELMRRVSKIIKEKNLTIGSDQKIYWLKNPIAILIPSKNYLQPKIKLIVDDAIDMDSKQKLEKFLDEWIKKVIEEKLKDLVNLKNNKVKSSKVRALCFQLFENNGVLKREKVNNFIKEFLTEDKAEARKLGIKIGRYHIYLPRMLKPAAVDLRIKLWQNFYNISNKIEPPKSGLNFVIDKNKNIKEFLLICGFENFGNFFVRIDILERLFLKVMEKTKNNNFEMNSEMMNLVGCNKENLIILFSLMSYKKLSSTDNKNDLYTYKPKKQYTIEKKIRVKKNNDNPFEVLNKINFTQ
jgi:ATP-dependent RNA helicase SUPV3L1/SUV3